jgi:hypothetical protein
MFLIKYGFSQFLPATNKVSHITLDTYIKKQSCMSCHESNFICLFKKAHFRPKIGPQKHPLFGGLKMPLFETPFPSVNTLGNGGSKMTPKLTLK